MDSLQLHLPLATIGGVTLTRADALVLVLAALGIFAIGLLIAIWRGSRARAEGEAHARMLAEGRAAAAEQRMADLVATQNELAGRLSSVQENVTTSQAAFSKQLDERLASVTGRVSASLSESTKSTQESLSILRERLVAIDSAQTNIQSLAQNVVGLQSILQDKQTRGAFGQSRMETIIRDGLPMGAFEFQPTLSNGKRPDCTIVMPNAQPSLVVDAKFPLEAWNALRVSDNEQASKDAATRFRRDMELHLKDISQKYLIKGETQDTAFLFVPSESIFAEIHENFESIVQRAHKLRVVIVSPSLLMLSVQVIQSVLKDARMREQAHLIQAEVAKFAKDLSLLDERVLKLQNHFRLTQKDVDEILTSTGKLKKHGERIEALEFGPESSDATPKEQPGKPFLRAIEGGE
ncbi:MAG: DNA recombination protein RmuC [Ahrensia sp.]|nr:DNA recombination protein RmuC [Ahrensia sp.]